MKFGKLLVFTILMLSGVSLVFTQRPLGPVAKWDPAVITLSHSVLTEGTTIQISATIKILKNVKGLKFKAGVDTQVIREQNFPNQLQAGTTLPITFSWTTVQGRHNIFFRLIPPTVSRMDKNLKLNKTINVVPRIQPPNPNPDLSVQTSIPQDDCSQFQYTTPRLHIQDIKIAATPQSPSQPVIIHVTIKNVAQKCIKKIYFMFRYYPTLGINQSDELAAADLNKFKYILKGGESLTHIFELYKHKSKPVETIYENGIAVAEIHKFVLDVPLASKKQFTVRWPLPSQ